MKLSVIMKIVLLLGSLLLLSCKKYLFPEEDAVPALPPNVLYFQITKNGNQLSDSILNQYKFYYYNENNEKVYRHPSETMVKPEHIYLPTEFGPNYHLDSNGVRMNYWIVYSNLDWYLEAPDGDIDTVRVTTKRIKSIDGEKDECYCNDPFTSVKFNGHEAPKHPTLKAYDGKRVYIFEK